MTITITALERSPDGGKGLARDTRVRWALEEVGQPYWVRLVSFRGSSYRIIDLQRYEMDRMSK
jgi:glutathione S-transferase